MDRTRLRSILLLTIAIPVGMVGAWALSAPESWFASFPGFGRDWLESLPPYNEHLARDFGGAYLVLAALFVVAALAPSVSLVRAMPAAFLLFAAPHFAFHAAHTGGLPLGDDIVNLVILGLSVAIPLALLALSPTGVMRNTAAAGPDGWRLPPAKSRNPLIWLTNTIVKRRFGHVIGPFAVTAHHPPLLAAYTTFELALENSNRIDRQLEELAATRAATLTGCEFCIDFASTVVTGIGVAPEKLRALSSWRESDLYDEDERLVLEYAEGMSQTPAAVSAELFARLGERFGEAAIVELTASIAFENYRGRFNQAIGLGSEGFCSVQPGPDGQPDDRQPAITKAH